MNKEETKKAQAKIDKLKVKGHDYFVAREQGTTMVANANNALMKNLNEIQQLEAKLKE
jgi:hypothetical protein